MAYPSQQPRYANAKTNYYDAPRSAPLESPREYRDDGYGYSQQNYGYDDGYGQGYGQNKRQPQSRQEPRRRDPRNAQGYPPAGGPQQRGPGLHSGHGQMRDPRSGGHRERGGNSQPYGNGRDHRQDYQGGRNGYSNNNQNQYHNQNQGQYDDGHNQGQYDDGYGYQQPNDYGLPQHFDQSRRDGGGRAFSGPQQGYTQGGYDQRPSMGQGRSGPNGFNPQRQERERIPQHQPHSPDTVAWDNPFPTFPPQEKRNPNLERPSTASGRYDEQPYQSRVPAPRQTSYDFQGHHDGFTTSQPQPSFAQAPQRSNTMPTDITQSMSNLSIQPQGESFQPPSRSNPHQHFNFSQPRRPSAGNQGGTDSRQQSQSRQPGDYNDILNSYDASPAATPPTNSAPFASPESEDMPNFAAAPRNGPDKALHMPSHGANSHGDERGRQQNQNFQSQDHRSQSQPAIHNQPGAYHETNYNVNVHSAGSNSVQETQNFPPRKASDPNHQRALSQQQQQQNHGSWQQQQHSEFGPPSRAQTDSFGPGQVPQRHPSDSYQAPPSRGMGPSPVGQQRITSSSQTGPTEYRGPTPVNGQRASAESMNRPRPAMSPPNDAAAMNGSITNPDALPGHPTPVRPGLLSQSQSPAGQARPPPVRNYHGSTSTVHGQQGPAQSPPQQQSPTQQPQPRPQPQTRAQPAPPAVEGPVTYEELQNIRGQLQQSPGNQALELHLAKRLVEAATILADEGGRADSRTKSKNRDKYNIEANRIVKKLVGYNYTEAMFYMAECYGSGTLGLAKDPAQAFTLYQSAAKLNHAGAAYRVAVCCELGSDEGGGTRRDPLKAVQWYQRAATLGDVPAMYKIGVIKLKGLLGQPQNPQDAVLWLRKAAEYADAENPHALHELALLYQNAGPNGPVAHDEAYAAQLFSQAADLGYKFSQFKLGSAYEFGQLGFPTDARQSITWYSKAATQDEHQSELALSGWYLTGAEGIMAQNDTEAYLWARKSANAGLAKAEYAMGYFTEVGIGCPADIEGAKRWYWKAASQNFPKARERLEELRQGGPKMQKARVSRGAMNRAQGFPSDLTTMNR